MTIPNLKRIRISTVQELESWLASNEGHAQEVMFVTCTARSPDKHVDGATLSDRLAAHNWIAGRRYTLNGGLVGQVARRG